MNEEKKMTNAGEFGGADDLPPAATPQIQMRRVAVTAYFVLVIALCWLALLQSQDLAGFAYFQF